MTTQHLQHHQRSRATHRQKKSWKSNKVLWIGVAIIAILSGIILFSSGTQGNTPANQTIPNFGNRPIADFTPSAGDAPRIEVLQDTLDFGDVEYNNPVNAVFYVRNVGSQPLIIEEDPQIEVIEGCCPPQVLVSSKTIPAGTESTVSMTFSMHEGMGGFHEFRVYVRTNDPIEPLKQLTVFSNWVSG
jgi:hypothetical protein